MIHLVLERPHLDFLHQVGAHACLEVNQLNKLVQNTLASKSRQPCQTKHAIGQHARDSGYSGWLMPNNAPPQNNTITKRHFLLSTPTLTLVQTTTTKTI